MGYVGECGPCARDRQLGSFYAALPQHEKRCGTGLDSKCRACLQEGISAVAYKNWNHYPCKGIVVPYLYEQELGLNPSISVSHFNLPGIHFQVFPILQCPLA